MSWNLKKKYDADSAFEQVAVDGKMNNVPSHTIALLQAVARDAHNIGLAFDRDGKMVGPGGELNVDGWGHLNADGSGEIHLTITAGRKVVESAPALAVVP